MSGEISVYGTDTCEDTQRTRRHLNEIGVPYRYINIEKDESAEKKVKEWNGGRRITPTVVLSGAGLTRRLSEPGDEELDRALEQQGLMPAA
ncbi:MAG: glutaredoxin family protein [Terriglobales bacterium]